MEKTTEETSMMTVMTADFLSYYVSSITDPLDNNKKVPISFRYNFEDVSIEQALYIASKDLTTDVQNNTRYSGSDSEARQHNKAARRREIFAEQEEKGFVEIMVKNKGQRFVRIQTPTEVVKGCTDAQLAELMEAIKARETREQA